MQDWLLSLLRCPSCRGELRREDGGEGTLVCQACGTRTAVRGGIPRFVQGAPPDDDVARRTQASFGYEWTHFKDWRPSGHTNFTDYFGHLDLESLRNSLVLDGGCGMGRHARQLAPYAGRLVAVDFSGAIDQASRNVADQPNVACVEGDLTRLPIADERFDFVYSMGVLHHLDDTEGALRSLVNKLKPGGRLRLYLYWKRTGISGALLSLVSLARTVTTRLPFPVLKAFCWILSVVLFALVILPYRLLARLGAPVDDSWPLFIYEKYPFNVLYNDQFDRFSAPLEKRYSAPEVKALLEAVGLHDVKVHPRYGWIGDGIK